MTDYAETRTKIAAAHRLIDLIKMELDEIYILTANPDTDPQVIQSRVTATSFKDLYNKLPAAAQAIQGAAVNADRADKGLERM